MMKRIVLPVFMFICFTCQVSFGQQTCNVEPTFPGWAVSLCGLSVDYEVDVITNPPSQVSVEWDFGDGTVQFFDGSHTYEEAGSYEICVTASTMQCSDTYCQMIGVSNPSPTFDNLPNDTILSVTDEFICVNHDYDPIMTASDPCFPNPNPLFPTNVVCTRSDGKPDLTDSWEAGVTTVTCITTGATGNTTEWSWMVTVQDDECDCESPDFFYLYGDSESNNYHKVDYFNNSFYVLGGRGSNASGEIRSSFSKIEVTGAVQWATYLPANYSLSDFVRSSDGYIFVGATQPFNFSSNSLICKIDFSGNLVWSKEFNFTGRELLSRIQIAPSSFGSNQEEFYAWGLLTNTGLEDDQHLVKFNSNGDLIFQKRLDHQGDDDQLHSDFLPLKNGNFVFMGFVGSRAQIGYMNGTGTEAFYSGEGTAGYRLSDAIEANEKIYSVGQTNTPQGFILVLDESGTKKIARYTLPNLERITKITTDNEGNLYLLGRADIGDGISNRNLVYKLSEAGGNNQTQLQIEWVKYIDQDETDYGGGFIEVINNDKLIYADARFGHPDGFGDNDAFLSTFDLEMNGGCVNFLGDHIISPPIIINTNITSPFTITNQDTPAPIDFIADIDFTYDIFSPDCEKYICTENICDDISCGVDTLILNTGYNNSTNTIYNNFEFDNFWELVQAPNPNITVPQPAYVIPTYEPDVVWEDQEETKWISAYPQAQLSINNPEPDPAYIFQNCFCVCSDSSEVEMLMNIYADDFVSVNLVNESGDFIVNLEDHLGFRVNTPAGMVDTTLILNEGKYCISAELRNLGAVVMGLNIEGHLTGASLIAPLCCGNTEGTIVGSKFHDRNCDGIRNTVDLPIYPIDEEGIEGWEISLCDENEAVIATTTTDVTGLYVFNDIPPGNYTVKEVEQTDWEATNISSQEGHQITIDTGEIVSNIDFFNKFNGEVELDYDFDCLIADGEFNAITWIGAPCDCDVRIRVRECNNSLDVPSIIAVLSENPGSYPWAFSTDFLTPGEYEIIISVCDGEFNDVGSCFTVADEPFVETTFSVDGCGLVTFNATVDPNETTGLTWNFNDGSPFESGEEVTHQFVNTNNFHVHLTLTLANGCKKVVSINGAVFPDQEFPVITCPEDISIEEFESPTPDITGFATATDDCDDDIYLTYSDQINGECPDTKIIERTWTATDDWGYSATCQQKINIICEGSCDVSFTWQEAGGLCYGILFQPIFTNVNNDNLEVLWTINGTFLSTTQFSFIYNFPLPGPYEICISIMSDNCVKEFCEIVNVPIEFPPTISCPSDLTLSASSISCDNSNYAPNVSTNCPCDSDDFIAICDPICTRSDSQNLNEPWPLGVTIVTCFVLDSYNVSSDTCQFTVTVEDNEAPICNDAPPIIAQGDLSAGGINIFFQALTATDNCEIDNYTCNYQTGDFFPCGTTEVVCTATDTYGNSTDCVLSITVDCIDCCTDTLTFCNRFDQGFQVSSNECNVLFDPIAMDTCDLVQIDWGDGVVENIAGDEFSTHEYNTSGDYQICILAYMPADDGSVCFGKNECYDICVTCDEECENATFGKLWGKSLNDYVSIGEPEADVLYAADKTFVVGGFNETINFGEPNETDYALSSSGDTDAFLVELDALGNPWNILKIGGDQYDVANSVARDSDGNIYVGGWFRSDTLDIYDGTGAVVHTLANAYGENCPVTSPCHPDIFIAKYDDNFTLIWAERYGSNLIDKLHDLTVDFSDNLIATGLYSHNEISFNEDGANPTILPKPELTASFVVKFLPDTFPKHDWSFALNSNFVVGDASYTIDTDAVGNIYVGGRFAGEVDFKGKSTTPALYSSYSDTYQDAFIAKYNPEGKNQWVVDIKGDSLNIPTRLITYDLEVVGDNLYAAGQTGGTGIYFDPIGQSSGKTVDVGIPYSGAFLAKYDIGNGHCQWVNGFDINGKCFNLSVDNQENVVISGFFHRYGNSLDMNPDPNESFILNSNYRDGFLAKYNSSGAFVTAFGALSPNGTSQFQSIDHDEENNLIAVGSNGSNAMDDDPDTGFHTLFNAGTVSDFYVGKFDCSCTPTDTDCCEDLMATIEQIDTCCYAISLQNDYGFSIPRITLDLETEDWNFLTTSLADNYQIVNTSNQRLIIEHNSGSIPSGNLEDIIEICLSTPNTEAASQQQIQLNWYENSAYPGDGRIKPVCSEILETTCNPMDTLTNCLLVVDTLITCMDSTQNEYELRFRVNNFTELDAIALFINDELGNTTFRTCDNPPILASTNLSYSLQPTPLLMGETSEEICLKIAPNQPILEPTEICYSLILEGDGGTDCCNEPVQFCFWLEPCCQLCEDNKVVVETLDDCCFALDIQNSCPPNFFTRIETIVLTEGVEFGSIQKGNSEFSFTAISNDTLDWVANSSFLPLGTFEDAMQFCLTGITDDTPTQEVIVNWYAIIPGSIEDSLFCSETLTFNCEPDNKECLDIYDVEICFVEEFEIYELNFAVQNVADPEFIGGQILVSTDQGFAIPNSIISTDLGANDSLIDGSLQFTTNPFPTELDSFEFIFTMKSITGDTCCQEFERLVVAPIPTEDDDCIVNTIELIEQQQILIYPNPFSTGFTIDFSEPITNNYKITLFDTFGKTVHQSILLKGNTEIQLQPNGLASGIYFLQISDEVGGLVTKKVVQQ